MRFCANVSMLFKDAPFVERFGRAAAAGFSAVEFLWPAGEDLGEVEAAIRDAGLTVALFNIYAGDMPAGDRGLLSDPERQDGFRENVPVALELAGRLGCRKMNALVGLELAGVGREEQLRLASENVAWAADRAAEYGVAVMIEAVNTIENGPYLLHTTEQTAGFVRSVGRENVALQYDVYHMQRMEGNLTANIREHIGIIGHVQVADSPDRGEPGTGEICYGYVLGVLQELGYSGYVGLEYNPTTQRTEESLSWLPEEMRAGDASVEALDL
jgi:hydroxypyruvate isomerase